MAGVGWPPGDTVQWNPVGPGCSVFQVWDVLQWLGILRLVLEVLCHIRSSQKAHNFSRKRPGCLTDESLSDREVKELVQSHEAGSWSQDFAFRFFVIQNPPSAAVSRSAVMGTAQRLESDTTPKNGFTLPGRGTEPHLPPTGLASDTLASHLAVGCWTGVTAALKNGSAQGHLVCAGNLGFHLRSTYEVLCFSRPLVINSHHSVT